ncbi:MAG TPA: thioredoxin-disulfide reductase [Candidatus Eremiobacteraeota bacterium]|nr:MAG: Thioredoxin reductase [bacterium ADurb.Bin363]HPZ06898.1 thioredoxin-disulfide reductase [Candidatus Eremiobacteraeota bacterium]
MSDAKLYNVIIIGSGPAGMTAALYTARADLCPVIVEGNQPGGQLTITTEVENFPGFSKGIMGPDLMNEMRKQAERFGSLFIQKNVTAVNFKDRPFRITAGKEDYLSKTVIIATGATARLLGLESEKKLMGHGVSACATCDGFFFRNQEVLVVGGGDSALEEATFLTKFASKVYIVHRRDKLRGSKIMQAKALKNPKIEFIWNSVVEDILGVEEKAVKGVKLRNVLTGEITEKKCDGVFAAIGHTPNTEIFKGQIDIDEKGYIIVKNGSHTNIPGVFAAGDVHDFTYRQAITAAGAGCRAAIDVERYLESTEE